MHEDCCFYLLSVCECHQVRRFTFIVGVHIHLIRIVQHMQCFGSETVYEARHVCIQGHVYILFMNTLFCDIVKSVALPILEI